MYKFKTNKNWRKWILFSIAGLLLIFFYIMLEILTNICSDSDICLKHNIQIHDMLTRTSIPLVALVLRPLILVVKMRESKTFEEIVQSIYWVSVETSLFIAMMLFLFSGTVSFYSTLFIHQLLDGMISIFFNIEIAFFNVAIIFLFKGIIVMRRVLKTMTFIKK